MKFNIIQLNRLSDEGQRLVANAIIRDLSADLISSNPRFDKVIVIFDELNKFAPRTFDSPVKSQIRDIVARGRSIGFTLGARVL